MTDLSTIEIGELARATTLVILPRGRGGRPPSQSRDAMSKLLTWAGATLGGTVGWWAGARVGVTTGFLLSVVGTGVGMYVGRWAAVRLLD